MNKTENPYALSNQGVEAFHLQHYGKAMAKFYQAKKILPRNSIITNNIEIVEEEIQLKQPPLLTFNFLTISESLVLLLIMSLLFILRKRISKRYVIQFSILVLFLSSLLLSVAVALEQKFQQYAVITEASVKAYSGNSLNDDELFELLDGQILKIIRYEKQWSQVEYDNSIGWVENDFLERI